MGINDTIAAISTPPGNAGIGVVRVSGAKVPHLIKEFFNKALEPRKATLKKMRDVDGNVIDQVIVIYYQKPKSYTGEEMLEIHTHGNPIILETILTNIMKNKIRPARPGEFTEKAFLNNKIDLAQAEAVSDLISSRNLSAIKGACSSMAGVFSKKIKETEKDLLGLRASIEATINFPEDDVPEKTKPILLENLSRIKKRVEEIIITANNGIKLHGQSIYCIVGQPNTGKSSLTNLLLKNDSSIVSNIPGTTRDSIQYEVKIEGCSLMIIDTAGLRRTDSKIEKEEIKKTKEA